MQINFLITRKPPDRKAPIIVEIFNYNGNSHDKIAKVIDTYWNNKPSPMLFNKSEYFISRMFKSTNGPKICMG